jgi:phosphoglucosamine mutase
VAAVVAAVEQELAGQGRVVLRASGTEPLIRVMVEALEDEQAQQCALRIAQAVKSVVPPAAG